MKTLNKFILALVCTFAVTACGSDNEKADDGSFETGKFNLEATPGIKGPLKDYFTVNQAVLEVEEDEFSGDPTGFLMVEVTRTQEPYSFDAADAENTDCVRSDKSFEWTMTASVSDASGVPIADGLGPYACDGFNKLLALNEGETMWLKFRDLYGLSEKAAEAEEVVLASTLEGDDDGYSSADTDDDDAEEQTASATGSTGSVDWDEALDDYEDFVEEYVALAKQAQQGDQTAAMEALQLKRESMELYRKMDAARGTMSPRQVNRMMQINQKMAAMQLQ